MSPITNLPKAGEPVEVKIRPRYYDHTATIDNAVPSPIPAEDPLYNKEEIYKFTRRHADKVWVINDGAANLYIRYSSGVDGVESFSDENLIYPGDYKVYYNVFELRLRSPLAGLPYRVSEYEIQRLCCPTVGETSVSGNVVQISGQVVSISGQSVNVPPITVDISGTIVLISGQFVQISGLNVNVSGSIVQISGQSVVTDSGSVTSISGNVVDISGAIVLISGQFVQISGLNINVSGSIVLISGQAVDISGAIVLISGQAVDISGQAVSVSGNIVQISGQCVVTDSGSVTSISGNVVDISGQGVLTSISGNIVQVSGQTVGISLAAATVVTIHNTALPVIGSSLIGGAITPSNPPSGFRTQVGISVNGQLSAVIINSGNAQSLLLSAGTGLNPGTLNIFDIIVHSGDSMDLTYSVSSGTIQIIRIDEISAMVI